MRPRVPRESVEALNNQLNKRYSQDTPEKIHRKEDLVKAPKLVEYMAVHAIDTPYWFDLCKVRGCSCCGEMRAPVEHQELALQRQTLPVEDPSRKGHCRDDALAKFSGQLAALTNLSDLPSHIKDRVNKDPSKRDSTISSELKMKSWDSKRIRSYVTCFNCGKRRCIYSPSDPGYAAATIALQQKLESVSERFSCGDLLFDDGHLLSRVIVQKQNLTCESQIEKGYYNNEGRAAKLEPICIHCGELSSDKSFLLG